MLKRSATEMTFKRQWVSYEVTAPERDLEEISEEIAIMPRLEVGMMIDVEDRRYRIARVDVQLFGGTVLHITVENEGFEPHERY